MQLSDGFITSEGLANLKSYKYKSGKYTWLDMKMNIFWEWCVEFIPRWMAPNLITFIGWIFVILSYAVIMLHDYNFQKDIPSYCFFFAAFCIFVYSTLDAIDGKQARKTKTSTPLGQLFDHGCDSFSLTFFMLAIGQAVSLSKYEVFMLFMSCQTSFWMANWIQYKTGVLQTNLGEFGVTQGEYTCLILHLISGFFGQAFFRNKIQVFIPSAISSFFDLPSSILDLKIGSITAYFYSLLLLSMCIYMFFKSFWLNKNRLQMLSQFLTLGLVIAMEMVWLNLSIYESFSGIILVSFGILQSMIICKMIICSVTQMKFQYFHNQLIPLIIGTILIMGLDLHNNRKGTIVLFWLICFINVAMILKFLYQTINQLTQELGIYCFSLQKRNKYEKKQ